MATETTHGRGPGHEKRDVSIRVAAGAMIGLAFLVVVGLLISWGVFDVLVVRHREAQPEVSPLANTLPAQPPEPRLQVSPAADLREVRAAETARLEGYGWVDRNTGVVRIPIERAMELIVERGLPARRQPAGQEDGSRKE